MVLSVHLLFLILFLCNQDSSNNSNSPLLYDTPFEIKRGQVIIPDSLGGDKLKGSIGIVVDIDSSGKILDHKIMRVNISDSTGHININYRAPSSESEEPIKKIRQWVSNYVNQLIIVKNPKFDKKYEMKKYTIGLRIKIPDNHKKTIKKSRP